MRKILAFLALALTMGAAHAEPVYIKEAEWKNIPYTQRGFCQPNEAKGTMVLLRTKNSLIVLSTIPGGRVLSGRWEQLGHEHVLIEWENGRTSTFHMANFNYCKF